MRRCFCWLAPLVAISIALSACSATLPGGGQATPAGPTLLRVGTGDSGAGLAPHEEIIARFEAQNPDIHIQVEPVVSDNYYGFIFSQIETGSPPDLLQIGDDAVPTFVARGALLPLDQFINGAHPLDTAIYLPGVLDPGRWDNQQYLLPKDFTPLAVYYNKKIFDQFGVDYPSDGWTWDDLLATAQALTRDTDGDGATDIWGVQLPGAWPTGFEYWVAANGGNLVSPDGMHFVGFMDSPETTAAVQFYADLYNRHKVAPPPADLAAFGGGNQEFTEGRAAMLLFGRWPLAGLKEQPEVELGVVGLPVGAQRANILLWSGFGISAQSRNQEAAWRFLRFYVGEEGAQVWKDWGLPTVKSVIAAAGFDIDPLEGPWISELSYLEPRAYLKQPRWGETAEPALRELLEQAIGEPEADLEAATERAAARAEAALADLEAQP